jgi:hypothetical protein
MGLFANIEDHRKPFLSLLFAIISLSTASFVYLSVDGYHAVHQCHNVTIASSSSAASPSSVAGNATTTTTAAPKPLSFAAASSSAVSSRMIASPQDAGEPALVDTAVEVGNTAAATTAAGGTTTTTAAPVEYKIIPVEKYLAGVTGGIIILALVAATSVTIVLSVYCRSGNVLKVAYGIFLVLVVALLYVMVTFGEALGVGHNCRDVGMRLVPSSVGIFVVGLFTALFFSDTLAKIRVGDDNAGRALLGQ